MRGSEVHEGRRSRESVERVGALDGLRGVVIVTVVLNHAVGKLWPRGAGYDAPILGGLLSGGAVSVFFVVGAFIVTRNLVREHDEDRLDPVRFFIRRLVRLGVQLVPLCAVLIGLHFVDQSYREPIAIWSRTSRTC